MTLFQLLRIIDKNCAIKIVDMEQRVLDAVSHKESLQTDFYDADVFKIGLNNVKTYINEPDCIVITLMK